MSIAIFYFMTDPKGQLHNPPQPGFYTFKDNEFDAAMKMVASLRDQGMRNVVISIEPPEMVGGFGVTSVVDGKTPSGEDYEWSKQGRAGKVRDGHEVRNGEDL